MITVDKSKRMTPTEMIKLAHERTVEENSVDQLLKGGAERNAERELHEAYNERTNQMQAALQHKAARNTFSVNVKTALLSECMYKLYKDCSVAPLTKSDAVIAKNMVSQFVKESGVPGLLSSFKKKNIILSEFSRITNKYYDKIMEAQQEKDEENGVCTKFTVDPLIRDEFLEELQDVDTEEASKLIKDRVSDAITEFIDSNMMEKLEYEEIISAAQDNISAAKSEAAVEQFNMQAKRKINEMKASRKKNVLHGMVESLCAKAIKDDALSKKYIKEGANIDMDAIVEDAELIYTMLEMVNTLEIVNVDESYIQNYIK